MECCPHEMPIKVKICGITNLNDGMAAAEAGADAVGFIFYERSPRAVSIEAAAEIIGALPPSIIKVGVFVDATEEFVHRAMAQCGLNLLQFHGSESPAFCIQFGLMTMKAFRIRDGKSLLAIPQYKTDAWLLDTYSSENLGGTGETFNWDLAVEAQNLGRPIFLAGGLTPQNIAEAVRRVHPYAVDVSSGVEATPGKKDHAKLKAFIQAAKSVVE